ncbi:MAG TPA: extracellular solute-binding protein [Dongiaceae bacterium]|nr:extracellular solute-binding protein [Dongiaceae bacterium]
MLSRILSLPVCSRVLSLVFMLTVVSNGVAADSAVTVAHGMAMHGDLKYPPNFTHFDYNSPDALKGGSVTILGYGTFDSLNPFIAKGDPEIYLGLLYDTLTTNSNDEPFSVYGVVAEKIEYPADRSWITFHINPKARFHDGVPITADDVVFTFNTLMEKGAPFYRAYYGDVAKVEALDKQRVKFTSRNNKNRELPLILGQLPVLPKHYWKDRDFGASSLEAPLGSGAYRLKSFEAGKTAVYERVKDYWGADIPTQRGTHNFDIINVDYYRDDTVQLEAFKAGRYDYRVENSSKRWATEYVGPAFDQGRIIKEELAHQNPAGMQAFVMNIRRDLFKDARVREALDYAFDFEWTNKQLFYNAYKRTNSYFANSDLAAEGIPTGKELALLEQYRDDLPKELFTQEYKSPTTDGSGKNRRNISRAIELLKSAGWEFRGTDLINTTTGQPFKFEILLYSKDYERIVLPFIRNLRKLGIEASARIVDTTNYVRIVRDFDFDMIIGGFGQSNSPGNEQRDFWFSQFADAKGSRNTIGIKDPIVDALIEKVILADSREDLVAACHALDRVLLWHHYTIPQFHINTHRIAYWNKFSRPAITPIYGADVGFMSWWIDPAKAAKLASPGKP